MAEESNIMDTVRDLKNREPFMPFGIVLTSGDRYLIEDPDALAITTQQLHYYLPRSEKAVHMRLNQIAAVEENGHRLSA
jgi:hypothetical protein